MNDKHDKQGRFATKGTRSFANYGNDINAGVKARAAKSPAEQAKLDFLAKKSALEASANLARKRSK